LTDKEGKTIREYLDEIVATVYGGRYMKILQTDNGPEFINQEVKSWCQEHNVEFRHGMPYRPTTQGQVGAIKHFNL
jgi:transposase InsO family protein